MKKIISILITASIIFGCIAEAESVSYKNGEICINGETSADTAVIKILRESDSSIAAVFEKDVVDGKYELLFNFADFINGVTSDGKYTVFVNGEVTDDFTYISRKTREGFLDSLKAAEDKEAVAEIMDADGAGEILKAIGVDEKIFSSTEIKDNFYELLSRSENRSEWNAVKFSEDAEYAWNLSNVNFNKGDISEFMKKLNLSYENVPFNSETDEVKLDFVQKYIKKNSPYQSGEEVQLSYAEAGRYYELSSARVGAIGEILEKHIDWLGLKNSVYYENYKKLEGSRLLKANDSLASKLSGDLPMSPADVENALKSCILENSGEGSGISGDANSISDIGNTSGIVVNRTPIVDIQDEFEAEIEIDFTDIDVVPWAEQAIRTLARMKIISGRGDNIFDPNANVTREEFVKLLVTATKLGNGTGSTYFEDVDESEWYAPYIAIAYEKGIVKGKTETTFGVGENITRQDLCVMASYFLDGTETKLEFTDSEMIADYAKEAVGKLSYMGIVNGMGDGSFAPEQFCTRAQAAVILYRILSFVPISQAEMTDVDVSKVDILIDLGILSGIDKEKFDKEGFITKEGFMKAIYSMTTESEANDDAVETMMKRFNIDYTKENKGDYVSNSEALALSMCILGYSGIIDSGQYKTTASQIGISEYINGDPLEYIKSVDAINLLYELLDCRVIGMETSGNKVSYVSEEENTVLAFYRDIYKVYGTVTKNKYTGIYGETGTGIDAIEIDDVQGDVYNSEFHEYLGYPVEAYVKDNSSEYEVMAMRKRNNKVEELVITADEFDRIVGDVEAIEYIYEDRIKRAKLSGALKVIFNGKFLKNFTGNTFQIDEGNITLLDNDNDGTYDLAFINCYETVVVDYVSLENKRIYNKLRTPEYVELDDENSEIIIMLDGKEVLLENLAEYDVLHVIRPVDIHNGIIKVYGARKSAEGRVKNVRFDDENKIKIDDEEKSINRSYALADDVTKPVAGESYTFYFDINDELAFVTLSIDGYSYIVAISVNMTDDEEGYFLKAMDMNGTWSRIPLAKKLSYSDGTVSEKGKTDEYIYTKLGGENMTSELLRVEYNNKNEISGIEKAFFSSKYLENTFTGRQIANNPYDADTGNINGDIFISGATVIQMPTEESKNENDYSILSSSYFKKDSWYSVTGYDMNEYNEAKVVVVNTSPKVLSSNYLIVTEHPTEVYNPDVGDVGWEITCSEYDTYYLQTYFTQDYSVVKDIKKGDVITIGNNAIGEITIAEIEYSPTSANAFTPLDQSMLYKNTRISGTVEDVSEAKGKVIINTGAESERVLPFRSTEIWIYDRKNDEVRKGEIADIEPGDFMFSLVHYSKLSLCYIIRK